MPDFKNSERGESSILLIILILIIGSVMLAGGFSRYEVKQSDNPIAGIPVTSAPDQARQNLQLNTFRLVTPTPTQTPQNTCSNNIGIPVIDPSCQCRGWLVECKNLQCVKINPSSQSPNGGPCIPQEQFDNWCSNLSITRMQDGVFCFGKPVIYLYPLSKTNVNVTVQTSGEIVVSDPLYPDGGWKNVEAHPDGTLIYENRTYRELFYESKVTSFLKPTNGIIIASSNLKLKLGDLLYRLGLNEWEVNEFLDFWVPKLKNLNSNFIVFSLIERQTKERIDRVVINPEPETRIEFIAYFKRLETPIAVAPLNLPERPQRSGFTSVEWGGTIEKNRAGSYNIY